MCRREIETSSEMTTLVLSQNVCNEVSESGAQWREGMLAFKCSHCEQFCQATPVLINSLVRNCLASPVPEIRSHTLNTPKRLDTALRIPAPISRAEIIKRLTETVQKLTVSGFYHRNLDWAGARDLLHHADPGAFLIRNSGDKKFIFSLSVQTKRGPTSVRLHFEEGCFRLDCEPGLTRYMPRFKCVVELISHYVNSGGKGDDGTVWVDSAGCTHSPVILRAPLKKEPSSLLHLARMAIHSVFEADKVSPRLWTSPKYKRLPLPRTLIDYLGEYPYSC